jgi:hypothetical protein
VHYLLTALATTPAPVPSPSLRPGLSEDQVTPGLLGFLLTAFIVILTALLITDMVRRIRRVRYRAQVEEERLAAAQARQSPAAGAATEAGRPAETTAADDAGPASGAGARTENNGDAGARDR